MSNIIKCLLCAAFSIFMVNIVHAGDNIGALPKKDTYIHTYTPLELKPASNSQNETKTAAIRFIGQTGETSYEEGTGRYGKGDDAVGEGNCSGFTQTCAAPQIGDGPRCDGKYRSCKCPTSYVTCSGNGKACKSGTTCVSSDVCEYQNCVCDEAYNTSCNGQGEEVKNALDKCDNLYKECKCRSTYKEANTALGEEGIGTPCTADGVDKYENVRCRVGYNTVCSGQGVEGVGTACTADGGQKYQNCKCGDAYAACTSPKVGVAGKACAVDGTKFSECACPSNYVTCTTAGIGTPCSDAGGTKYTSCQSNLPATCEAAGTGYYTSAPAGKYCDTQAVTLLGGAAICYKNCTTCPERGWSAGIPQPTQYYSYNTVYGPGNNYKCYKDLYLDCNSYKTDVVRAIIYHNRGFITPWQYASNCLFPDAAAQYPETADCESAVMVLTDRVNTYNGKCSSHINVLDISSNTCYMCMGCNFSQEPGHPVQHNAIAIHCPPPV